MANSFSFDMEIPVGWFFRPTDEELILEYLKRKIATPDLFTVPYIKDVDLYNFHPRELTADHGGYDDDDEKNEYYFFTQRKRKNEGGNSDRASRSVKNESMWKATSGEQEVMDYTSNEIIGYKTTLVYFENKKKESKTNWIMHEYRATTQETKQPYEWVICRIFERAQSTKKKNNKVVKSDQVLQYGIPLQGRQESNELQEEGYQSEDSSWSHYANLLSLHVEEDFSEVVNHHNFSSTSMEEEDQNHGKETQQIIQDFNRAFSVYMDRGLDGFLEHQFL
ncbi:NAC domain-containing protein 101-like [Macadamia integrifolia]|uniref:NAC domain-containing protein 101-like n=1 Tax=Macadamia integrifolia TaxID=60698 RepID=UPI001C4EE829|nr:NAC domain-containing protein 101-like [Macadamia integrifolia]